MNGRLPLLSTDRQPPLRIFPSPSIGGDVLECKMLLESLGLSAEVQTLAGRMLAGTRPDVNARCLMSIIAKVQANEAAKHLGTIREAGIC